MDTRSRKVQEKTVNLDIIIIIIVSIIINMIISILIPTAPRIPPHHPSQREERRGVMSLVGQLLKSLSCLVAKLFSVLGCSLVE